MLLKMKNIVKTFGDVVALNDVDFDVKKGEIHALLGENGAGKSTLMNILYGLYHATDGQVILNDEEITIDDPTDAISHGIGMVHQHFMLIDELTVIENVVLGMHVEKSRTRKMNIEKAARDFLKLCKRYNMSFDPYEKVSKLTVGQEQRLEILKAMYRGAKLLILDEPTAVLIPSEIEELFLMIKEIVNDGTTVVFISHKLNEIMEICDRVTVLRNGNLQGTVNVSDTNKAELAKMMVGKEVFLQYDVPEPNLGEEVLSLEGVTHYTKKGVASLSDLSLSLRAGEVLGIAGVDGNGQTELVDCITGLQTFEEGTIKICGEVVNGYSPRKILDLKVGHVPEDRHRRGCMLDMSLVNNIMLMNYHTPRYSRGIQLLWANINDDATELLEKFNVKYGTRENAIRTLSGGNQQKLVLAREISKDPKLLIAMHPVRGLDIGATEYIHQKILEQRERGAGVLLVSTELSDLFSLSDRIAVMYEGEVMGVLDKKDYDVQKVGMMMAGTRSNELGI